MCKLVTDLSDRISLYSLCTLHFHCFGVCTLHFHCFVFVLALFCFQLYSLCTLHFHCFHELHMSFSYLVVAPKIRVAKAVNFGSSAKSRPRCHRQRCHGGTTHGGAGERGRATETLPTLTPPAHETEWCHWRAGRLDSDGWNAVANQSDDSTQIVRRRGRAPS